MVRIFLLATTVLLSSSVVGQQVPGLQLPPLTVAARPCLMAAPQILVFTMENRYHRLVLFNTCTYSVRWSVLNPFPFIRVDTSQAANPVPPGKMTPVGVYIDWTQAPSYAIAIRDPAPVLGWLEKVTGRAIPRQGTIYLSVAFIAFCERNTPARACVPALIFLLRVQT